MSLKIHKNLDVDKVKQNYTEKVTLQLPIGIYEQTDDLLYNLAEPIVLASP